MTRFIGPLAGLWPDLTAERLRPLLLPPERALPGADLTGADGPTVTTLVERAEADLGTPWPPVPAHAWARFRHDGDRQEYESQLFARTTRLSRAVVAAACSVGPGGVVSGVPGGDEGASPGRPAPDLVPGADDWLAEVADGVILLCEQSSWCWPAHDDAHERSGFVLPDVTRPFLDLGAGEVAAQLAWTWQLVGDALEERFAGIGERVRLELDERVFDPFLDRRDWHWLGLDGRVHNWNPWIHGNVLVAALRLLDWDLDKRAQVVALAVEGLDRYVAALPDDGAVDEGHAYWWQGAGRALEALAVLRHATGGRLDAFGLPSVKETVAFPHRMHLGGGWHVDYADASAKPTAEQPWAMLHRIARLVGDGAAAAHAAARRRPGAPVAEAADGLGRLVPALIDREWAERSLGSARVGGDRPRADGDSDRVDESPIRVDGRASLPRDVWLPSTQVFLARERAGSSEGLAVSAKGGHNGENHNHLDVGTFIVALDGVPVVVDAGRTTYTARTFGPDRYSIPAMRSEFHNLPVIAGQGQGLGERFAARHVDVDLGDGRSRFTADLAGAYPAGLVQTWRRTVALERRPAPSAADDVPFGRRAERDARVVVADEWVGAEDVVSRHVLAGDVVERLDNGLVVRTLGGGLFQWRWDPGLQAELEGWELEDPLLTRVWGDRLTVLALDASGRDRLTVTGRRHEQKRT